MNGTLKLPTPMSVCADDFWSHPAADRQAYRPFHDDRHCDRDRFILIYILVVELKTCKTIQNRLQVFLYINYSRFCSCSVKEIEGAGT